MATQAESDYNLATVRNRVAAALGFSDTKGLSVEQAELYNSALRAEILKYPNAFTPEVYAQAQRINTSYDARGNDTRTLGQVFLDSAADSARAVNPLDTSNLPTVAKWIFFGLLVLGAFWLFLKTPRPPSSPSPARA